MVKQESRKQALFRNTKFGAVKILVQYILQFIIRTIFIWVLGKEYLGLNGLFSNIIGCLNIVELGMGTAIVFSMYKPVSEGDTEKIKSLNQFYKKTYHFLAVLVGALGLAVAPFLKYIIKSDIPSDINIYVIYFITLFNTVLSYLWAHKRSLLFANQRNDIESKIGTIQLVLLSIVQIILLLTTKNYYSYCICVPIFSIIENLIISNQTKKLYPEIRGKAEPLDQNTKKEIKKNIVGSSMSQVGAVFVTSTDNIIISSMLGLAILGVYSNYAIIISAITACLTLITSNARSTLGNMIASETKEYVYERYKLLNFIMYWLTGFCSISLLCLLNPFISIWTNSSDYVLNISIVTILIVNFYVSNTLAITSTCNISAGLMWFNKWKTILQGIVNIVFSIIFVKLWGLIGVFVGTLASYISAPLWIDSHVLFKHFFKDGKFEYWKKYIIFTFITFLAGILCYYLCGLLQFNAIVNFILKCGICLIIPNLVYLIVYYKSKEFKEIKDIVGNMFKKIFQKKPNV